MKTRMALKLIVVGDAIVAVACWLRGHDVLTGVALALLFLVVVFKMAFAVIARRGGGRPPGSGGADLADRPESRPPGGRPPVLSAAEEVRHESAA
jgi:hypothetical protein